MNRPVKRGAPYPTVALDADTIADRATSAYIGLCKKFAQSGKPVNFDFRKHCTAWTARGDHLTHRLHRYPARLTPYIPLFFLSVRGVAVSGGRLLDPFAGCGTVLVEAPVHPAHPMCPVGFEINPLARLIAKVKTTPIDRRAVLDAWGRIRLRYNSDTSKAGLPSFPNKRHWFSASVEKRLARVLRALESLRDRDLRDFFLVAASAVVRQVSLADPSVAVPVIINPGRFKGAVKQQAQADLDNRQDADVWRIMDETVRSNLLRLRSWADETFSRPSTTAIIGADARTFKTSHYLGSGELSTGSRVLRGVDLVLTSPPYANAQRYTRSLRLELFVLGFTEDGRDEGDLDRLQVGTERVAEPIWEEMVEKTDVATADAAIRGVLTRDKYRAAIVGKYVRDMDAVVKQCYRALRVDSHAIFVIGNNCVRGVQIDNAAILAELGERTGFSTSLRIKNKIPSRGLLTKRHHTAGVITHEHVVVLKKPAHRRGENV